MAQTLSGALGWWARMRSDQPAIIFAGDTLSYHQWWLWANRIAVHLHAQGVQPGDRVAVCATNSLAYCALIMGVIRAGAIVAPINFRYTAREIAELCEGVEPALCFAGADQMAAMAAAGYPAQPMAMLDGLRDAGDAAATHDDDADAPVVIIATSGSTARPKGVVYTNRSVTAYAASWATEDVVVGPGSRVITLAPLNTSAGFVQLAHYMVQGCTLYMEPQFDALRALRLIEEQRINAFGAVPAFFEFIAALPEFADADLSSLTLVTAGGARVSPALLETYRAKGVIIRQIYGQTEIGGNVTMMPAHLALSAPHQCGWGGVFMDVRVVRPDGADCAPDEPGEIIMRSPGMMQGYWRNPQETAKAIRDGWLYSGDIGSLDGDGLLTFVDRMKDIIISGGLNISAAEVERVLCEFAGVNEALVIAAPDEKFGETPFAVLHGPAPVDVAAVVAHCNANLSNYKVPRYIVWSAQPLPRLATGKLSKPAIRAQYAGAHATMARVR